MKLDRNKKPFIPKYAIIRRRDLDRSTNTRLDAGIPTEEDFISLPRTAIETGSEALNESGYFVIKLKDRFAAAALRAYATEVRTYALSTGTVSTARDEMMEYAGDIAALAREAENLTVGGFSKLPD